MIKNKKAVSPVVSVILMVAVVVGLSAAIGVFVLEIQPTDSSNSNGVSVRLDEKADSMVATVITSNSEEGQINITVGDTTHSMDSKVGSSVSFTAIEGDQITVISSSNGEEKVLTSRTAKKTYSPYTYGQEGLLLGYSTNGGADKAGLFSLDDGSLIRNVSDYRTAVELDSTGVAHTTDTTNLLKNTLSSGTIFEKSYDADVVETHNKSIYLTGEVNNVKKLDSDGTLNWSYSTIRQQTGLTVNETGYVFTSSASGILTLDPDGNKVPGKSFSWGKYPGSALGVTDTAVYMGDNDYLYKYDFNGNEVWNYSSNIEQVEVVSDNEIYYAGTNETTFDGEIGKVRPDGTFYWKSVFGSGSAAGITITDDGSVYSTHINPGQIREHDPSNGNVMWKKDAVYKIWTQLSSYTK